MSEIEDSVKEILTRAKEMVESGQKMNVVISFEWRGEKIPGMYNIYMDKDGEIELLNYMLSR